jgi:DNA-binding transcriptional LysR family regulator
MFFKNYLIIKSMSVFDDMGVFIAVYEKGSFSAAGRELRMSPALISSRIARLENHLGVRLFNRTTRTVTVTEAGQRYYGDCLDIRRRVAEAESRLAAEQETPSGVLKLTSSSSFGRMILTPLLPKFAELFPDVQVQFRMTDRLVDMLAEGMDVSVRVGPMVDSSLKARTLANSPRYIFGAPEYLKKRGIPKTPNDLVDHDCLLLRYPGSRQFRWRFWNNKGEYDLAVTGRLDSNSGEVLKDWALAGAGLVLKTYWEVADEVKAGKLVPVLTEHMPTDSKIAALYPYDSFIPPRVRAFIDFLAEEVKKDRRFQDQLEVFT